MQLLEDDVLNQKYSSFNFQDLHLAVLLFRDLHFIFF